MRQIILNLIKISATGEYAPVKLFTNLTNVMIKIEVDRTSEIHES